MTGGTGISVNNTTGAITVTNTGVTSLAAGTGVTLSATTGAVTISASGGGGGSTIQTSIIKLKSSAGAIDVGTSTWLNSGAGSASTWASCITSVSAVGGTLSITFSSAYTPPLFPSFSGILYWWNGSTYKMKPIPTGLDSGTTFLTAITYSGATVLTIGTFNGTIFSSSSNDGNGYAFYLYLSVLN
jgi:hypothetical protein